MAKIHLPNTSWFSVEVAPGSYQHKELAQQVLAHKAAVLSKQLQALLAAYEADVDGIESLQKQAGTLAKRIQRLSPQSRVKPRLKSHQVALRLDLKAQEKALLSSKTPLKISEIRRELKQISYQLGLPS